MLDGLALPFVHFDGHVRVPVFQALQVMGQEVTDHRVTGRYPQQAGGANVRQWAVEGVLDAAQDHVGPIEKVPSGIGQAHALGRALEQ